MKVIDSTTISLCLNTHKWATFRKTKAGVKMDRGYLDYGKYDDYCVRGIRFVSRLKNNAIIEEIEELATPEESTILRDVKVILGKGNKRMQHALRMVESVDSKGNPVRILTNRFDLTAEEIKVHFQIIQKNSHVSVYARLLMYSN